MIPMTIKNPTWLQRRRCSTDSALPRTASIPKKTRCPPSKIGIGKRLRMARFTEKSAMNRRKVSSPICAALPEAAPMVTMLPRDRGETPPVTRSRRKSRIRALIPIVSAHPSRTARARDTGWYENSVMGGHTPTFPIRTVSPVKGSSLVSSSGVT